MTLKANIVKRIFKFSFKARTSRGLMKDKTSWFIVLSDRDRPDVQGIGECGPLPGLSPDATPELEDQLSAVAQQITSTPFTDLRTMLELVPAHFPSIRFGLETALLDLVNGGKRIIYQTDFINGKSIDINGLIWMGDLDFMMSQINEKIAMGFRCIKLKVGGLDFDRECDVLQYIRKRYFKQEIEIRLDANGAFKLDDALYKLTELSRFNIQSIEQPIKSGQPEMEELCRKSPIPVAFDEELIGKYNRKEMEELLISLKPKYIVLKPTLLGGFSACDEWILTAEANGIGWWITSALESNIGLNAICQYTSRYPIQLPQGLGTGGIYENNIPSPLEVSMGFIRHNPAKQWETTELTAV
jgi:o-succinylbenzoate synthase